MYRGNDCKSVIRRRCITNSYILSQLFFKINSSVKIMAKVMAKVL